MWHSTPCPRWRGWLNSPSLPSSLSLFLPLPLAFSPSFLLGGLLLFLFSLLPSPFFLFPPPFPSSRLFLWLPLPSLPRFPLSFSRPPVLFAPSFAPPFSRL